MDLKHYFLILWGNKWIILTTLIITLFGVMIGTILMTPIYSASATLRVATASANSVSYTDYQYADRLMNTYTRIATSKPVLDEMASRLNLLKLPDVKVSTIPSTELLQIVVKSPDPTQAQNAANTLGEILITQSQALYSGGEKSTTEIISGELTTAEAELNQARLDYETLISKSPNDTDAIAKANLLVDLKQKTYESLLNDYDAARVQEAVRANIITIVEPAILPLKPSQPKAYLNIALGFMVGLVGGIGLAFLNENLNPRLYTLEQIETISDLDILEKIPFVKSKGFNRLVKRAPHLDGPAFNASFQKLQTKITQKNTGNPRLKSILFTSAVPSEGKSTIVANLALAMGKVGQNIIVIDSDLHLPVQHKIFNLPNKLGLSTLLTQQTRLIDALQKTRFMNTWVLTSGPNVPNSMELLGSPKMKSVIELLAQKFDYVLIDSPALLPVGDAIALSNFVDGIIVVTRQFYCKEDDLKETIKQLGDVDKRIMGLVINDAKQTSSNYYNKYKYP
jgi:succinoglycan biosynthesis transport protein ExoP